MDTLQAQEDVSYAEAGELPRIAMNARNFALAGMKFAGYVGCQTNRPFGIAGESFENPKYLDKLIETMGGEAVPYDQKVTCCGGALAFSEPEMTQTQWPRARSRTSSNPLTTTARRCW